MAKKTWEEMTKAEREAYRNSEAGQRWATKKANITPTKNGMDRNTEGQIYSDNTRVTSAVQPEMAVLNTSPSYSSFSEAGFQPLPNDDWMWEGEDIRESGGGDGSSGKTYLQTDNYSAQDVENFWANYTGPLQNEQGQIYRTGVDAFDRKHPLGPDIGLNLGSGEEGFVTPRQYQTNAADYISEGLFAVIENIALGALTGGTGLLGSLGAIGQGAEDIQTILETGNTINNLSNRVNDEVEDQNTVPEISWQLPDVTDVLGDVQVQVHDFQLPNEGGGGSSSADSENSTPEELSTGDPPTSTNGMDRDSVLEEIGQSQDPAGELGGRPPEGEFALPNHAPKNDGIWVHQNPDGTWVAGNELGEIWETVPPEENGDDPDLTDNIPPDLFDIIPPSLITNDIGSVSVNGMDRETGGQIGSSSGNNSGNTGSVDSDMDDRLTTGQPPAESGQGTGTGGGNGSGAGDGDGDGDGNQGGDTPIYNEMFGNGNNDFGDLFPYSQISPSRPAQLGGMMDYVAALLRQRRM